MVVIIMVIKIASFSFMKPFIFSISISERFIVEIVSMKTVPMGSRVYTGQFSSAFSSRMWRA